MYSAHFAVTWFQHGFGQEELFNSLYAHTYTKSLYTKMILYLWFIFNFETPQVLKVYSAVKVYSSVKNSGNERPYLPNAIWMTTTSFEIWNAGWRRYMYFVTAPGGPGVFLSRNRYPWLPWLPWLPRFPEQLNSAFTTVLGLKSNNTDFRVIFFRISFLL